MSTSLPAPIIQPDVETWNNFIYVIGGSSTVAYGGATTTVLYAVPAGNQSSSGFIVQSSGTLSSWLAATPLPSPLYEEGSAVADGYLYTVGGKNSSGATTTVQNTGLYTSCIAFNSVTNYAPSVSAVSLNGGNALTLTANATTSFSINYSVTDPNGCSNIASVTSTAFRTGVAGACATANPATDNRNCYLSVVNSTSSCAGTNYNETDTVALYYFADSTGITTSSYPTQHWEAYATVLSNSGLTASATSSNVDVNVLSAINVTGATSSVINYGALSQNANTGSVNQTTTVQNAGNSSTTLQIYASQVLTSGTSTIPAAYQHYATSSFTFGGNEQQLTTSTNPAFVPGFVLTVPTSTASVQKLTYWGAGTPAGQAGGSYQGTTMFAAGFSQ